MSEEIETAEEAATATATGIRVETPEISVDISRYPSSVMLRSLRERFLAVKVTVESPPMEKIIPDAEIRSGDQVVPKDLVAGARFRQLLDNDKVLWKLTKEQMEGIQGEQTVFDLFSDYYKYEMLMA